MTPISESAKIGAAAVAVIVIAAFGWYEYRAGYTRGAAEVQDKWDRQIAQVSQQTTDAIAKAASDAMENSLAAGVVSTAAQQHQADVAAVHDQLTKRVQAYANRPLATAQCGQNVNAADVAVLSDDGLRIWNDANAGIGGSASSASASAAIGASGVSADVAISK
ncbi:hypothetical protein [Paraburkholderia sp. J12]|uniref:hypothetical protein n=1 Tax=Paraburkholderia sp. J12 TaxID=2805432 RepID=UPI002ABE5109|nr:hypothetical protein [Paraburkholderia sp. J12]